MFLFVSASSSMILTLSCHRQLLKEKEIEWEHAVLSHSSNDSKCLSNPLLVMTCSHYENNTFISYHVFRFFICKKKKNVTSLEVNSETYWIKKSNRMCLPISIKYLASQNGSLVPIIGVSRNVGKEVNGFIFEAIPKRINTNHQAGIEKCTIITYFFFLGR